MKRTKPHLSYEITLTLNYDTMEVVKNLVGYKSLNEWVNDAILRKLAINAKDFEHYSDKDLEIMHKMGVRKLEA